MSHTDPRAAHPWTTAQVRALLLAALDDPELDALCLDHYPGVFAKFSRGLRKDEKVQLLLAHLARHRSDLTDLVALIEAVNPGQVARARSDRGKAPEHAASAMGTGAAPSPSPDLHGTGDRWAVLVGVDVYDDGFVYGKLDVCVNGATETRDALVASGYNEARIHLLTDGASEEPTRANILTSLQSVANAAGPDDLLLFYYCGHGEAVDGASYLVALDGHRVSLPDTGVPVDRIKEILQGSQARAKVIVLDSCHSGADIASMGPQPMTADFIRRVFQEAEGLAILASCKQGELSYVWKQQSRGVFTHYWVEALTGAADRDAKGFVTVQDAARHVTNGVKLWASQTNHTQTPTLQAATAGDIVLADY